MSTDTHLVSGRLGSQLALKHDLLKPESASLLPCSRREAHRPCTLGCPIRDQWADVPPRGRWEAWSILERAGTAELMVGQQKPGKGLGRRDLGLWW